MRWQGTAAWVASQSQKPSCSSKSESRQNAIHPPTQEPREMARVGLKGDGGALRAFLVFLSCLAVWNWSRCVSTPITLGKPCTCTLRDFGATHRGRRMRDLQDVEHLVCLHLEAVAAVDQQEHEVRHLPTTDRPNSRHRTEIKGAHLGGIDERRQVVVHLDERQPALLPRYDRDRTTHLKHAHHSPSSGFINQAAMPRRH